MDSTSLAWWNKNKYLGFFWLLNRLWSCLLNRRDLAESGPIFHSEPSEKSAGTITHPIHDGSGYVCHIWFAIYHQQKPPPILASIYHTTGSVMGIGGLWLAYGVHCGGEETTVEDRGGDPRFPALLPGTSKISSGAPSFFRDITSAEAHLQTIRVLQKVRWMDSCPKIHGSPFWDGKWMKMNENEWKWMKMNEHEWKWMKMNEHEWKWMKMNEHEWKWMNMNENEWK